jgi:hypothetical protein
MGSLGRENSKEFCSKESHKIRKKIILLTEFWSKCTLSLLLLILLLTLLLFLLYDSSYKNLLLESCNKIIVFIKRLMAVVFAF